MSMQVTTENGGSTIWRFTSENDSGMGMDSIEIDRRAYPIGHFCRATAHFLLGGCFGWPNRKTPEPVAQLLDTLFEEYEKIDGEWVRKHSG